MIGKTQEEVAALTENLYNSVAAQPAPQPVYAPPVEPHFGAVTPPDPNLAYSNPQRYQQELLAYQQQTMQTQFDQRLQAMAQPILQQNAQTARILSKQQHPEIWRRWEPEIELELRGIPDHARTSQMYDTAVRLVRGAHVEELARERAATLGAGGGTGSERASSAAGAPAPVADKLDAAWDSGHPFFENAKEQRVTKEMIRQHCAAMKISVDDYVRDATRGEVITSKYGFERRSI